MTDEALDAYQDLFIKRGLTEVWPQVFPFVDLTGYSFTCPIATAAGTSVVTLTSAAGDIVVTVSGSGASVISSVTVNITDEVTTSLAEDLYDVRLIGTSPTGEAYGFGHGKALVQ